MDSWMDSLTSRCGCDALALAIRRAESLGESRVTSCRLAKTTDVITASTARQVLTITPTARAVRGCQHYSFMASGRRDCCVPERGKWRCIAGYRRYAVGDTDLPIRGSVVGDIGHVIITQCQRRIKPSAIIDNGFN